MLRFLRKMRQALIPENRFGRYFFYAVGEIVLVVIGILIALQINNWNEERKLKLDEGKYLLDIKENIELNIQNMEKEIGSSRRFNSSRTILLNHIRNKLPYHDSLAIHFHRSNLLPNTKISMQAYESLKQKGINIIESEDLRGMIIKIFEGTYSDLLRNVQKTTKVNGSMFAEFMMKNFEREDNQAVPNDYNFLLSNQLYINLLVNRRSLDKWDLKQKEGCIKESERVIKLIEQVIARKK